jgi:hypothetical protein
MMHGHTYLKIIIIIIIITIIICYIFLRNYYLHLKGKT